MRGVPNVKPKVTSLSRTKEKCTDHYQKIKTMPNSYKPSVELVLASKNQYTGVSLYTFKIKMPKSYLAQLNTHRILSKNASSSRAVPVPKLIERIRANTVIPMIMVQNKPGMWGDHTLNAEQAEQVTALWLESCEKAIETASKLHSLGLHKEYANRILEPYCEAEILLSGTQWNNFISLRAHYETQPEMQYVATQIKNLIETAQPQVLGKQQWHTPFIREEEEMLDISLKQKVSVARCARVSYFLKGTGEVSSLDKDIALYNTLKDSGHWSPFEHVATPYLETKLCTNYLSWVQLRQSFRNSHGDSEYSTLPFNRLFEYLKDLMIE